MGTTTWVEEDRVVLLDEQGRATGSAPREGIHGADTPLHLAFSCWLFDGDGRFLLTRRALTKRSWPGVWTNSFCGHPRPGEDLVAAIHRYGAYELGVSVTDLEPLLPEFSYRAVDASGVVENEHCPVYVARTRDTVRPRVDEVMEHEWIALDDLRAALVHAPWAVSPWLREQARSVEASGGWEHLAGPSRQDLGR
jgi:isopentenyl-diphosphate delta-isomerase